MRGHIFSILEKNILYLLTNLTICSIICKANPFTTISMRNKMNTEKDLRVSVLLDYYAPMLTDKQRDVIDLYYNEDLSLSEIAEHEGITRQGVRDSIKRGEQTLYEMEEKFHLAERSRQYGEMMSRIAELAEGILTDSGMYGNPKPIMKRAENIAQLAEENKDLF